mmetsp:Transcript_69665/g.193887  ORF Transcript_69665/g.193887 Transcript_69665/m.193887 type:complete len:240 (+) Transcript_69665:94-813(+)
MIARLCLHVATNVSSRSTSSKLWWPSSSFSHSCSRSAKSSRPNGCATGGGSTMMMPGGNAGVMGGGGATRLLILRKLLTKTALPEPMASTRFRWIATHSASACVPSSASLSLSLSPMTSLPTGTENKHVKMPYCAWLNTSVHASTLSIKSLYIAFASSRRPFKRKKSDNSVRASSTSLLSAPCLLVRAPINFFLSATHSSVFPVTCRSLRSETKDSICSIKSAWPAPSRASSICRAICL